MSIRNTTRRWGVIAQLLHWVILVLIIAQFVLAIMADDLPNNMKKLVLLSRHKSIGLTVFALALVRLGWRWGNATPPLPSTLKPYERLLARGTHALLYVLLLVVPFTGWIMSSAHGFPVSWFGVFQLPDLVAKNHDLSEVLEETHETLAWTLAALVALHAGAALKHHFILKDDVLRRMLPSSKPEGTEP
ncbi:MAG: cytochrome b [Proteobacteria bacterium]|nr:cytochrome b [Pseudomonadota bacterium]